MKEWESLLGTAAITATAVLCSQLLIKRLKRKKELSYDVRLGSGERQKVKITSEVAENPDSAALAVVFRALEFLSHEITPESRAQLEQLIAELERQRSRSPLSRPIAMLLGRAYRAAGNLEMAIEVLARFIANKEEVGEFDSDLGNAYYNMACYLALTGNAQFAVKSLRRAIELDPQDLESSAMVDPDLSSIREYFPELLKSNGRAR